MKKLLVFLFFLLLLIFLIFLSLQRYFLFQLFYYDFGIFSQIIWQLSRFKVPYINHLVLGRIFFLGDHFNPSLVFLAPLYWLTSHQSILLLEQGLVTFLSSLIIYKIALKKKLHFFSALVITLSFVAFAGTLNPLLTDWHPEPTATFFLLLFIYIFLFSKKTTEGIVAALIFLGFKESNALTLIFVCFWLLFVDEKKRRSLIFLILFSIFWFFATTRFLIPLINKRFYLYTPEISFDPVNIYKNIINDPVRLRYLTFSLMSFAYLPLFSGWAMIPFLRELMMKFLPQKTLFTNFDFKMHYHTYLGAFLTVASIFAICRLTKKFKKFKITEFILIFFLLLFSLFSARKHTGSPINLAINSTFWREMKPKNELFSFLKKIPQKGSVMSTNNLLAYLSNRNANLYFLSLNYEKYLPDIIVFDLSPNQNPNNYWESNWEKRELIKKSLEEDKRYKKINFSNPNYYLFIKK